MKSLLLSASFAIATLAAQAQDIARFNLTPEGVAPVVIKCDSLTASQIYTNAKAWVMATYKNPDKVLKEDVPNERIRINGYEKSALYIKTFGAKTMLDAEYSLEIDIKDGKIRAAYIPGDLFNSSGAKLGYTYKSFYKDGEVRGMYKDTETAFETSMNAVLESLTKTITAKKEDW